MNIYLQLFLQSQATRQQLERFPRRFVSSSGNTGNSSSNAGAAGSSSTSNQLHNQQQSGLFVGGSVGSGANGNSTINQRDVPISSSTPLTLGGASGTANTSNQQNQSQFLLARFMTPSLDENELIQLERDVADR